MNSFQMLNLSAPLQKAVDEMGFATPSPIQEQALPILLGEPTDFIGLAATGTGKTAAFSIPLLERIDPQQRVVQGLVMCPTRELALQVSKQIDALGKFKNIRALPVYGGAGYNDQIQGLRQGAKIVVGTPGRIIDHIQRGTLKLNDIKTIILDEADEMISMGFQEDLETILEAVPRESSNIWLFSATMSREVRGVADNYLQNPQQVQVNRTEMLSTTVEQIFYPAREYDKPEILCKLIDAAEDFYGIIFCQTKSLVTDLSEYLTGRGYKVDCLHGDKDQKSRERTMQAFRDKKVNVLVCTDVASRGLDVKDVTHVINYSIPRELDTYVHRIGRTARSGKSGIAISLVTPSHRNLIFRIEKMTKSRMKEGKLPTRREIGVKKVSQLLPKFLAQESFERALELLDEDWKTAIALMSPEEIVGRFLALTTPEVFENREKAKKERPAQQQSDSPKERRERSRSDAPERPRPQKYERPQFEKPTAKPRYEKTAYPSVEDLELEGAGEREDGSQRADRTEYRSPRNAYRDRRERRENNRPAQGSFDPSEREQLRNRAERRAEKFQNKLSQAEQAASSDGLRPPRPRKGSKWIKKDDGSRPTVER